ncbi:hypothetical protein D9M69_494980 [compost metagenome]
MGKLVRDDVIDDRGREMDQAPVQHDVAVAGAGAPARGGRRQAPAADFQAADLQEVGEAGAEPGAGALLQPGLRRIADAALVRRGGQRQPQRVAVLGGLGVAGQIGLAAVAAYADHDALAQVGQFPARLPARVRHGQLLLAGMPFAQLGEDPARFFAHRVVDLRQRDPIGGGDAQAVVRDHEADAAAARAQQHKADGLLFGRDFAPARAGRQRWGRADPHGGGCGAFMCFDPGPGARQRVIGKRDRFQVIEQDAAHGIECARALAAQRAQFQVAGQDQSHASRQVAGGPGQQQVVVGVVSDVHRQCSSRRRSWATARRTRDFTVPSGMHSWAAMRACGASSK